MRWIKSEHSKNQIRKAGEILKSKYKSSEDTSDAFEILSNWRSSHAYPMHSMLITLRKLSSKICSDPIVVQRLKRAPSIISKLKRMKNMSLERMQDIGGCRSVVRDIDQVRILSNLIKNSRSRHTLYNEKDYIMNPKESGYRCIHLIYKYNASKIEYKNFLVELQIRSRIQHAWATAVEVVDIFTKQALKANFGKESWKDFFRFVSVEFAKFENAPISNRYINEDTLSKIKDLEKELLVKKKLTVFTVSTQHIAENVGSGFHYYLLVLNTLKSEITIRNFKSKDVGTATDEYKKKEKEHSGNKNIDVVLVSSDSVKSLKKAYPSLYLDHPCLFLSYAS